MEDRELKCVLCNVQYASEQELEEHNWSLMHHIKIEKVKKGAPHSCTLCMTSCPNIIEYGKHLNEDNHKIALGRRQNKGTDEPLDSFANSADLDMSHGKIPADPPYEMAQWPTRFQTPVNKHSRSFSQPDLHMQTDMMFNKNGKKGKKNKQNRQGDIQNLIDFNPTQSMLYTQGQWPGWDDLNPGFSQSMGNLGEQRPHFNPSYRQVQQGPPDQFFSNNYNDWNWNSNSFYTGGPWENGIDRNGMPNRRGRRGSFDSSYQPRGRQFDKPRGKNKGKYRDRSFDGGHNMLHGNDDGYWDRRQAQSNSGYGYDETRDGEFVRPAGRRDTILERGRGAYRDGRNRGEHPDEGKPDKYSPESTSSTDSGGLKRRRDDESHHTPGKSRRDNESNRIPPDSNTTGSLLTNQRARSRSRSYEQLHDRNTPIVNEGELSCTRNRHVTWSDQQLELSSVRPEQEYTRPARTMSLERLSEPKTFVKPDSTSGGKKGKKKGKGKAQRLRNYSPEDDTTIRKKGGKTFQKNNVKEKSSTDNVLEKAEKLCKKLRNEREKAKQQRIIAEKQKKMSKTEEINFQIEELSKRNKENIKGHLELAESALLASNVIEEKTKSIESSGLELEPVHDKPTRPSSVTKPGPSTESTQKQTPFSKTNTEISNRIAQTRADIDAIRAKIENSVQSEMSNSSSTDTSKTVSKPDNESSKSGRSLAHIDTSKPASHLNNESSKPNRSLAHTELLSPGAAYSPANSVKKMDQNALLNMVKSPRSTKERLWLAEMLRTHAKSRTRLSFPRFNLKFSDLCTGSDRPNDLTDFDIGNLAPSVQLEIANIIEADTKPNVTELEKLLDQACEGNAELDSNILSELGIFQTPERPVSKPRSPSPMRTSSPIVTASHRYVDHRPSLSIEDLSTVEEPQSLENIQPSKTTIPQHETPMISTQPTDTHRQKNSITISGHIPGFTSTPQSSSLETFGDIKIKEEKIDFGYEAANTGFTLPSTAGYTGVPSNTGISSNTIPQSILPSNTRVPAHSHTSNTVSPNTGLSSNTRTAREYRPTEEEPNTSTYTRSGSPHSPVRKSILPQTGSQPQTGYTQNTYSVTEEPERDVYKSRSRSPETNGRTALEKVTAILDGVPPVDKVLSNTVKTASTVDTVVKGPTGGELDKEPDVTEPRFDSSQSSQTSSVLDQVYNISLQEENVRHEINTVDTKIQRLQKLIDEAANQLNTFTAKRKELVDQEDSFRSSRMKLLQESRSQQGSSMSQSEGAPPLLGNLTDTQLQNLNNPVFIKFLMSQRQRYSDMSSMGGFSNVETGSQSEQEPSISSTSSDLQQRGSAPTSTAVTTDSARNPPLSTHPLTTTHPLSSQLFAQSIDALSGSTETLSSTHSKMKVSRDSGTPVPNTAPHTDNIDKKTDAAQISDQGQPSNSVSLLNAPLDKVGFVTLDALLKGDSDLGKLLQTNLETFNSGKGEETKLKKQTSADAALYPPARTSVGVRERKDSVLSVGSADDILMSGSDGERRSGKVSMKYMGTLPEGISYDKLAKQMSAGNSNKTVMFTVLNSPELKKMSDGELSPQVLPMLRASSNLTNIDTRSDSSKTETTITGDMNDFDTHSVRSNFSLGEQIKRMCEGQNPDVNRSQQIITPRSDSSGDKTLEETEDKQRASPSVSRQSTPVKECYVKLEPLDLNSHPDINLRLKPDIQRVLQQDAGSPVKKRLKSKKERDQLSRRKQKESFILHSDTNSEADVDGSHNSSTRSKSPSRNSMTRSEDDIVLTGSEDAKTPRLSERTDVKKSLLDEVQLETDTPTDSCEDRSQKLDGTSYPPNERLRMNEDRLTALDTNDRSAVGADRSISVIEYPGPSLSVAALQHFQDELYVCYNGSEIRRFDIKTGKILKELDCSPYLVSTLRVTNVPERGDIMYTGGPCKKLMLFEPKRFNLIATFDYESRITCLHENWSRLYIGLADGSVSVRSLKTDKELNVFNCTSFSVSCMASTSAGLTKMLCLGTTDRIIYVVDSITGLLITMLEGHTMPPLCIEVFGETVLSGAADQTLLVHKVSTGEQIRRIKSTKPVTCLWTDTEYIYLSCCDNLVRCYNSNFKLDRVCYGAGKGIVTCGMVQGGMLITGNREGLVEALSLAHLKGSWECKFGQCNLQFPCYDHLQHHVLSDHNTAQASQCTYRTCSYSFPSQESKQEHLLSHLR